MQKLRKAFVISVVSTMVLSMSMLAVPISVGAAISAGDLVTIEGDSAVYYIDADDVKHVFPNESTYKSWYRDFSTVKTVTQTEISAFTRGSNITVRPGTKLITSPDEITVYAVEPGGVLKSIVSEANAIDLWGDDWASNVIDVVPSFMVNYSVGDPLTEGVYPAGTLLQMDGDADVYYYDGTDYRKFADEAALLDNRLSLDDVVTTDDTITAGGTEVSGAEADLIDTSEGDSEPIEEGGSGLSITLASDNPEATSILSDGAGTALDGQALIPALKLNFTAAADGDVKVKTLKLTRSGISADSDIDNAYLYDGDDIVARLAEMQSIADKVITFSDSSGLFTVPAGATKSILVRFDLNRESTSGKTIGLKLASTDDVTAAAEAAISGSFPMMGNMMSTATVTDFGAVQITRIADNSTAVDPGTAGFTAAHYQVTPSNQDMELQYLKLRMIGSASVSDLSNIQLYDSSNLLGTEELDSDGYVTFDLTDSPLEISSSQTKNLYVKVDVDSGSTRTFYFSIEKGADAIVYETEYGIYLRPKSGSAVGTFTTQSSSQVTVGSGSLTVGKTSDSPTGNIADGATNITFAKYSLKATGESIKVSNIGYYCEGSDTTDYIDNVKIMIDGTQQGTTDTTILCDKHATAAGTGTTTVNFTVPEGETKYLTLVGDTADATLATDATIAFTLNIGSSNGQRMSSLGTIDVPASNTDGNTLTVKAGTVVSSKNSGMGDYDGANPLGVVGAEAVKIGSFNITAGAGEDVDITKITLQDNATQDLGGSFKELMIKNQSTGEQIGSEIGTLQTSTSYNYEFSPVTPVRVTNGDTLIIDVYADILTNAADTATAFVGVVLADVSATGVSTSASADDDSDINGQNVYINASGSLLVEDVASSDKVQSNMVYASTASETNEVELMKFKLTALVEAIDVTRIIINDAIVSQAVSASTANGKPTTSLLGFKLYEGSTLVKAGIFTSTSTPTNGGYIDFNFGTGDEYVIGVNEEKTLTLKGTVNSYAAISSGSTHTFSTVSGIAPGPLQDSATYAITARGHDSSVDMSSNTTAITGNAITVRRSYPIVTKDDLPTTALAQGTHNDVSIAKFKVTAQGDKIALKKITLDIALNDTTTSTALELSEFLLYRNGTAMGSTEYSIFDGTGTGTADELSRPGTGTATLTTTKLKTTPGGAAPGAPSSTSTRAIIMFAAQADLLYAATGTGEETLSAGTSNTYELKCKVTNAHQGTPTTDSDSITVQLLGESSLSNPTTDNLAHMAETTYRFGAVGFGTDYSATNYNFIWSDNTANTGDHTSTIASTGDDWTYGYQIRSTTATPASYIPLGSWTLSR